MFKNTFLLFFVLFLVSCQNLQQPEKPKKLLSPTEMEEILTDMILLDAMISVNNFRIDNHEIDVPNFVYHKYDIDSLTLLKNIEYYNEEYEQNIEIYNNVKTNIEELKEKIEQDKKIKDSIERVKMEAEKDTCINSTS